MSEYDVTKELHRRMDEIDRHMETVSLVVQVLDGLRERVENHQSQTQDLVGVATETVAEMRKIAESSRVSSGSIEVIRELLAAAVRSFEMEVARVGSHSQEWESSAEKVLSELESIRSQFLEGVSESSTDLVRATQQQRELFEDAIRQAQRPLEEMEKQLNRARHDLKETIELIQPMLRQSMEEIKPLIVEVASPAVSALEDAFRNLEAEGRRINDSVNQLLLKVETEVVRGLESSLSDLLMTADRLREKVSTDVTQSVDEFSRVLRGASSEVRQSSQDAVGAMAAMWPAQEAVINGLRREVDELRELLSGSRDFERVASALSANLELMERISSLLTEHRPSFSTRLELSLIALALGVLIGKGLGGLQMMDAVLVALPAAGVALWSEPIVSRFLGRMGSIGGNGRGRTN